MRLTGFIELAAIVIGIAGVVAGQYFGLPKGVHLGVLALAVGAGCIASAYLLAEGRWHATVHRLERSLTQLLRSF
jgi:hypothetical protein